MESGKKSHQNSYINYGFGNTFPAGKLLLFIKLVISLVLNALLHTPTSSISPTNISWIESEFAPIRKG